MCRRSSLYQFTYPLPYATPVTCGEIVGKARTEESHHSVGNYSDRLQRRCYDTGKSQIIQCRIFCMGVQVPYTAIDVEFEKTITR
jgi:hypothetical protein